MMPSENCPDYPFSCNTLELEEGSSVVALQFIGKDHLTAIMQDLSGNSVLRTWNFNREYLLQQSMQWLCQQFENSFFSEVVSNRECISKLQNSNGNSAPM